MPGASTQPSTGPLWREVHGQLVQRLASFGFGDRFLSISEVCREFGVSTITAIRALNELAQAGLIQKKPGVGNVVRAAHQAIQIRLVVARNMASNAATIDPVIQRLISGASRHAAKLNLEFSQISERHLPSLFPRDQSLDGFLIFRNVGQACIEYLHEQRLPYVLLDPLTDFKGRPHVRVDRTLAGYLAAKHLLDLGHRRIAWITGPLNLRNFRARLNGYRKALKEAGVAFDWELVRCTDDDHFEQVDGALALLLQRPQPPTAIIAGDDHRALELLASCRRRKISVPADLSVVGYPDYPESRLASPALTVVDGRFEAVSHAAVQWLVCRLTKPDEPIRQQVRIAPRLVTRGTTAPPPEDPSSPSHASSH